MERRLLTVLEASEYLGIKVNTLYGMTSQKRIPYVKIDGKILRFDLRKLEQWIEAKTVVVTEIS